MTCAPLLAKAAAYQDAITGNNGTPLHFDPEGPSNRPWKAKQGKQGQALETLKSIERELSGLKYIALVSREPLPLKSLCQIVHAIGEKALVKMSCTRNTFCDSNYYLRVTDVSATIIEKLHLLVFVRIEHEVEELLPILRDPAEADRLILLLENIESAIEGPWTTPSQANTLQWKKIFLICKLAAMKALWQLQEVESGMDASPLLPTTLAVHEAAIDRIYTEYTNVADGIRILQADFYKVKLEKDYLKLLCTKARIKAFWASL
jgi:hypothetical protein